MIGGVVIDVCASKKSGNYWVNVKDSDSKETCQIWTSSSLVGIGDKIWWQGKRAFITNETYCEKEIDKIGFSGTIPKPL